MSFPHNLVLDSQPRFGLTQADFSNLYIYIFLINYQIFMKSVAKCSSFVNLSCQEHVNVCNHILLKIYSTVYIGQFSQFAMKIKKKKIFSEK